MGARDDVFAQQAEAFYRQILRAHMTPPRCMSASAWADEFRHIAKGPEKGQWRTLRTPYLAEPMACTDPESPVQKLAMMFATQLGKSEAIYNAILKRIHLQPMDMMMVQPTLQDAKDHSRERFMPTVRATPSVRDRMPKASSRDETNTWQTKQLPGGATLYFAGANSARSLASKPLPFAACDEIDGYPHDVDGEGDPLSLVWERMSNFGQRKLILVSTPTTKGFSRIEDEFNEGDRCRYFVPCLHCNTTQELEWGTDVAWGIKWLRTPSGEARPETAVYVCKHCGGTLQNHQKTDMLAAGLWVPEAPGAQGGLVRSFTLNKLYSPVGWKSWPMLVSDWERAQIAARSGDNTRLKTFINTSLAQTWEESGDRADEHALRKRAADIPLRQVQWGLYVATMGVDTQGDRLEAYTWAWGRGLERQLVDRQVIYGDPSLPESEPGSPWKALTDLRRAPLTHASGRTVPLLACAIDSGGHHTQAVYVYVRAHQYSNVLAVKGSSQANRAIIGKPAEQDVNWRGQKLKRGVKLWPIGTDTAKEEIYGRLRNTEPGPGFVHLSKHLPAEVFEQITSERLVTRYVKGRPKLEWVKPAGKRNEGLDCAVYALAAAHWLGMERWREHEWAKWEAMAQARDLFDTPQPPPAADSSAADAATAASSETASQPGNDATTAATQPPANRFASNTNPAQPAAAPRRLSPAQPARTLNRDW
jgi:phage terminase large subunit GpA-like protein